MKVIFICGCSEPGRDGVGDYVRRLSAALILAGHSVSILAINDTFVSIPTEAYQICDETEVSTFRVPANFSSPGDLEYARNWVNMKDPDILSLQFVPFSFHIKGLAFGLTTLLRQIGGNRKWHIMFHELWVGMDVQSPAKHVVWGWIQRELIKSLIKKLQPVVVHTQTRLYQMQLDRIGTRAEYLPLFTNIPRVEPGNKMEAPATGRRITMVIFGSIHPGAPVEELAQEALKFSSLHSVAVSLVLIGKCGAEQERWVSVWKLAGLPVEVLGEQSALEISKVLSSATIGISTTVSSLLEKSGSVAAMQAHGLPILCVSRTWKPRGLDYVPPPKGTYVYKAGCLEACLLRGKANEGYTVTEVSKKLEQTLLPI